MSGPTLIQQVRALMVSATEIFADDEFRPTLDAMIERLDEPLRLAIAGKVKAGKSTLLNALVGEELAPTDAGECTKIVTWYREGHTYRVDLYPKKGEPRQVPFTRDAGALEIDIGDVDADDIDHLVVKWPTSSLKDLTLIDTPGIASLSTDVSARSHAFIAPDDERVTPADAVLYLMRHLHATDINFLESFHDQDSAQPSPINAIGVLSRADEVAVGRIDAMASATRIADRYRGDPKVRRLVQTVVPVAGLIAESGTTLREAEFQALRHYADSPRETTDAFLLSADRFVKNEVPFPLTEMEREHMLDRFGLFGIRLGIDLLQNGGITTASGLADAMVDHSGLNRLRDVLLTQFAGRRDILKARSGLLALQQLVAESDTPAGEQLESDIERVIAGAHEFAEIRLTNAIRMGAIPGKPDELEAMERLLGGDGSAPAARLGLDDTADLAKGALDELQRWQRRAENPLTPQDQADACRVCMRTCEGMIAATP